MFSTGDSDNNEDGSFDDLQKRSFKSSDGGEGSAFPDRLNDGRKSEPDEPGKWKYAVVIGSFWVYANSFGLAYSAGILQVIFMEEFRGKAKAGLIAVITTLLSACMTFSALPSSILTKRFGFRIVGFVGNLCILSGFIIASKASEIWVLFLSFCLIGCGFGAQFVTASTIVCQYFHRHRPIAVGISSIGSPVGTFIFPPLIRLLVDLYGYRTCLLALGGISFVGCAISGLFFTPPPQDGHPPPSDNPGGPQKKRRRKLLHVKLLKNPLFVSLMMSNVTFYFGVMTFWLFLSPYLISIGISKDFSALFVSLCGATGIVGRLVFGLIAQKLTSIPLSFYRMILMTITGMTVLTIPFCTNAILIAVVCGVYGLTFTTNGFLLPLVIAELGGLKAVADGYGYSMIAEGLGCLIGPPLAGLFQDFTDSYFYTLLLAGLVVVSGCVLTLVPEIVVLVKRRKQKHKAFFRQQSVQSTAQMLKSQDDNEEDKARIRKMQMNGIIA